MKTTCAPPAGVTAAASEQPGEAFVDLFNGGCFCIGLDDDALRRALESEVGESGDAGNIGLFGADRPMRSIAIVDAQPQQQYLYPEFLLFQRLFQRHGIEAAIADPGRFELRDYVYDGQVQWVAARLYQGPF